MVLNENIIIFPFQKMVGLLILASRLMSTHIYVGKYYTPLAALY